jgi:Tol biopolymer transport system component
MLEFGGLVMSIIIKRIILVLGVLLFLAACTSSSPTSIATDKVIQSSGGSTPEKSTALPTQEPSPIPTQVPVIPTDTQAPTKTPLPMVGSGAIVFGSNRDGDYMNIYTMNIPDRSISRLTNNESNTFPGPYSPKMAPLLFTGFGLTHSYVGVMNVDGSFARSLSDERDTDEGFPTWAPDGMHIAFTSRMDGNNEIYVMDMNGMNVKRLTNNPADDFAPAWSPDGSTIAFVSDRDNPTGVNYLYLMNADGSGVVRLTNGNENDYSPAWSPDGNKIAFRADIDGNGDIYVVNAEGSGRVNLTNNPASDWSPAWSPDGSLIAFQTNRDGNWEIYVMNSDGSQPINLTENPADDQMPYWKPVGSKAN